MAGQPRPSSPQVMASGVRPALTSGLHTGHPSIFQVPADALDSRCQLRPQAAGQYTTAAQVEGRGGDRAFSGAALPFPLGGLGSPEASAAPVRLTAQ